MGPEPDYSRAALARFIEFVVEKGLVHPATAQGWRVATSKVLEELSVEDAEDVRRIDLGTTFRAFLNRNPGRLSPASIGEYRRRVGRAIEEFVFFHRTSATVILADLIENFEARKLGRGMRWIARLGGVLDPDGKTPLDMRMTFLGRRRIARECFGKIIAWHPRRAILAHGRWYPENADAELRRAFRWLD